MIRITGTATKLYPASLPRFAKLFKHPDPPPHQIRLKQSRPSLHTRTSTLNHASSTLHPRLAAAEIIDCYSCTQTSKMPDIKRWVKLITHQKPM
jgi:hypothetical protein